MRAPLPLPLTLESSVIAFVVPRRPGDLAIVPPLFARFFPPFYPFLFFPSRVNRTAGANARAISNVGIVAFPLFFPPARIPGVSLDLDGTL